MVTTTLQFISLFAEGICFLPFKVELYQKYANRHFSIRVREKINFWEWEWCSKLLCPLQMFCPSFLFCSLFSFHCCNFSMILIDLRISFPWNTLASLFAFFARYSSTFLAEIVGPGHWNPFFEFPSPQKYPWFSHLYYIPWCMTM